MSNRLPLKDRLRDHPLMAEPECDECRELLGEEPFEYGNDCICRECHIRHVDEAEAKLEGDR
jgi:hypothetical protein